MKISLSQVTCQNIFKLNQNKWRDFFPVITCIHQSVRGIVSGSYQATFTSKSFKIHLIIVSTSEQIPYACLQLLALKKYNLLWSISFVTKYKAVVLTWHMRYIHCHLIQWHTAIWSENHHLYGRKQDWWGSRYWEEKNW